MRNCGECKKDILCDNCDKLVNQKKNFHKIFYIKRQPRNDFGNMLPWYKIFRM